MLAKPLAESTPEHCFINWKTANWGDVGHNLRFCFPVNYFLVHLQSIDQKKIHYAIIY